MDSHTLISELESLVPAFSEGLGQASSLQELEELRVAFLGRKGKLAQIMTALTSLPAEERPAVGKAANEVKTQLTSAFEAHQTGLERSATAAALSTFDPTLPGREPDQGSLHVVTLVMEEICNVFKGLGYDIVTGPEVENDYYNFEALNMPSEHPARDMQDTLYITDSIVLRTHTSPLQVRTMLARKPPVAVIAPGKVYRRDSDLTHTPMFHQIEGLLVDTDVSMADLRGTLTSFVQQLFGSDTRVRFRPSFFPLYRAQRRGGHLVRHVRRQGARGRQAVPRVQGDGLGGDSGQRHDRPRGVQGRGLRRREVYGVRVRPGRRARGHAQARHRRPAHVL